MTPVRLRLSRRKGFDLQAASLAANGLQAVRVARPCMWGNPFVVSDRYAPGAKVGGWYFAVPTVEDAVECHRLLLEVERPDMVEAGRQHLAGRNLACWCKLDEPCHADTWLRLVNAPRPPLVAEAVNPETLPDE